jgi:hypothetical protein
MVFCVRVERMSDKSGAVVLSEAELEPARQLVDRILDYVSSDPRWPVIATIEPGGDTPTGRSAAMAPAAMLSVLDAATKDEELLAALESKALIDRAFIELTQAKLTFDMTAALSRQGRDYEPCMETGARARQILRAVSETRRRQRQSPPEEQEIKEGDLPPDRPGKKIP